jgi:hypothetical protein
MPYMVSGERLARKQELLAGLEVALKLKFGAEGLQVLPELRQLREVDQLRAVLQAIETVTTLDELRQVVARPGPEQPPAP